MKIQIQHKLLCILLLLSLAGCLAVPTDKKESLPYYSGADFTPYWLNARQAGEIHHIQAFAFVNQQGDTITQQTVDNKITVVDFFFASCPGICKKLTKNLSYVQTAFKDDSNVVLLSHTVTPERDSLPVLKKYARLNNIIAGKWHLLTGVKTSIYAIARQSYFADEDLGMQLDSTSFLHTENVLLIDRKHHIRGVYKGTIPAEINNLIADIRKLETVE